MHSTLSGTPPQAGHEETPEIPQKEFYTSSPIKPRRRGKADMQAIRDKILELLEDERPMTVRQLFYRLVSEGAIGKTEGEYQQTVVRLTSEMRRAGDIPYGWIADNTRWVRKPSTYTGLSEMLKQSTETYRRSVWHQQDVYVEVWLEKDALSGVVYDVTAPWDVPLMVTRGYASLSFLHSAGEAIKAKRKPTHLYYLGDYDPSGVDIPVKVEEGIREFAPDAEIWFERIAVNEGQIEEMGLPTRPTKKSDSRSKNFEGESVEVDAIHPVKLRELVDAAITKHIDADIYRRMRLNEALEQKTLTNICEYLKQCPKSFEPEGDRQQCIGDDEANS